MITVSDTSPLNYLILIDAAHVLPQLFGKLFIPPAVREELSDPAAPEPVRQWMTTPPDWLHIRDVASSDEPDLQQLHRGECEAILLAEASDADLLLLDERLARQVATERNLSISGTLGLLNQADEQGLLDASQAVEHLQQTSFRAAPSLYEWLMDQHRQRRS